MYDQEEITYQLYIMRCAIQDCVDKLKLPKNRELFLVYYGISSKQSDEIEKLFLDIVKQDKQISFSDFNQMLNKRLDESFAPKVVKELLEAYKEYEPIAISKIK